MPKFLDAPTYYNSNGEELSLDMGFQTYTIAAAAQAVDFHFGLRSYGRYRLDITISTTATLRAYVPSLSTPTSPLTFGMLSVTPEASGNIWFEWGKLAAGYYYDGVNPVHIVFYNVACNDSTGGSSSIFKYCPGTTTVVVWGESANAPTTPRIYTDAKLKLNGASFSDADRGEMFYAPTLVGASGQILTSNGIGAPSWTSKFSFEKVAVPSSVWDDIDVTDTVVATTTVMSIHIISCTFLTGNVMYLFPIRSTSTTTITSFSGVVSLVYGNNHFAGANGSYNEKIIYGVECSGPTSFYLHCVA